MKEPQKVYFAFGREYRMRFLMLFAEYEKYCAKYSIDSNDEEAHHKMIDNYTSMIDMIDCISSDDLILTRSPTYD